MRGIRTVLEGLLGIAIRDGIGNRIMQMTEMPKDRQKGLVAYSLLHQMSKQLVMSGC